jgi:cytochrome c peroxidase
MKRMSIIGMASMAAAAVAGCSAEPPSTEEEIAQLQEQLNLPDFINTGSYSLHLENNLRFNKVHPAGDADRGRRLFGLAPDLETSDPTEALFEGFSAAFGGVVVSNGRSCFTCHRGVQATALGLTATNVGLPLSNSIPLTDPLFTGLDGDAQGDPDGFVNLNEHGLIKYRPGRFNPARPQSDPFRKVFFWRKSAPLMNVVFSRGFLLDGRMREMFETDRGAVFSHTQESDTRFDDLFTVQDARDFEAFQFAQLTDPALAALLDENDPNHDYLATHPFATVNVATAAQWRGRNVFIRDCMACHNTPNVFNNIGNVQPRGDDLDRQPNFPPFGPHLGRTYNIGVSERNKHNLRFTVPAEGGGFEPPLVIQLANENGSVNNHTVTFDIGLAATTGKTADIGRFKVPQLRNVAALAPYFHDNSADTLEEVIEYFNSNHYNNSKDGKKFQIHQSSQERADLLAFLQIL